MILKKMPITLQLLILVLPLSICLACIVFVFVDMFNTTLAGTEKLLYDELYVPSAAIINADRDFYQAAIAEKELILTWDSLSADERDAFVADFQENMEQVRDRMHSAIDSVRSNSQLFNDFSFSGKTVKSLETSFFDSFDKWLAAYDIATNSGNLDRRNNYFSLARDDINTLTELLDEYAAGTIVNIEQEASATIDTAIRTVVIMLAVLAFISVVMILYLRNNIRYITGVCNKIADGQFNIEINRKRFGRGEIGQLCRATSNILNRLNTYVDYISEITDTLTLMASGDMRIHLTHDYAGEFTPVKEALLGISGSLGNTLAVISQSSEQVNSGASQISSAAQSLAEGSSKQAGAVENLFDSMKNVVAQVNDNAANAISAESFAIEAGREVGMGNRHMNDMLAAMEAINKSSAEVAKIMKVIDDIAFQTNILALNAAVEAARAGSAGKGFAVVAEEVRNLAGKSAEAATQTAALIQESVKAAEDGQKTAGSTAASLKLIEEKTLATRELVENIATASKAQSDALEHIKNVIGQVSDVVQSNAAMAEQSSAASEELSAQVDTLNGELGRFKLPDHTKALGSGL